jgi:DNA-binding cell septation regulator SpoVG
VSTGIEVLAIRATDGHTSIKAFADIRVGGVTILGCKIVQQEGQRAWLAMPSSKSERGWNDVIRLSSELRERVQAVALEAWEAAEA